MKDKVTQFESWEETQAYLISAQTSRAALPIIVAIMSIFFFTYEGIDKLLLYTWLVCALLITMFQTFISIYIYNSKRSFVLKQRLFLMEACSFIDGIVFSVAAFFSLFLSDFSFLATNFILSALCLGSTLTTIGYRRAHLLYVLPITLSMFAVFIFKANESSLHFLVKPSLLVSFVGFIYFFIKLSAYVHEIFKSSYDIRMREKETNEKLQAALAHSEQLNKDKTRFLAAASHDLRQPINALSLFSSVLNMQKLEGNLKNVAENITIAIDALAHQLDALLDVSKLDAGVVEKDEEVFDLSLELEHLYSEFKTQAHNQNLEFILNSKQQAFVLSDKYLLDRVLRNLISNAFKYTERGFIKLSLVDDSNAYKVLVEDTGVGIPKAEQLKVFHEFYQLHNQERNRKDGLGLGLSIVKRLSDLLGLNLQLSSEPDQGTSFTLSLPKAPAINTALTKSSVLVELPKLNILIVDDDEVVVYAMQTLLESQNHETRIAEGTEAALEVLESFQPDIILVDFRLREGDSGIITVQKVNEKYPNTPAIIITGDTAPDRLQEAKASNLTVLHKPIKAEILNQAMLDLLSE